MSDEDLRDFFPLPKVVEGIFKLFEELFNVKFQQIEGDFPKWHEDLTLFAVQDAKSGQTLGHFYFDPFIRDEKGYAGADKGTFFSKVKISLVIWTTFEFSRQKHDAKMRENRTFLSVLNPK